MSRDDIERDVLMLDSWRVVPSLLPWQWTALVNLLASEGGGAVVEVADSNRPTAEGNVSRNPTDP